MDGLNIDCVVVGDLPLVLDEDGSADYDQLDSDEAKEEFESLVLDNIPELGDDDDVPELVYSSDDDVPELVYSTEPDEAQIWTILSGYAAICNERGAILIRMGEEHRDQWMNIAREVGLSVERSTRVSQSALGA